MQTPDTTVSIVPLSILDVLNINNGRFYTGYDDGDKAQQDFDNFLTHYYLSSLYRQIKRVQQSLKPNLRFVISDIGINPIFHTEISPKSAPLNDEIGSVYCGLSERAHGTKSKIFKYSLMTAMIPKNIPILFQDDVFYEELTPYIPPETEPGQMKAGAPWKPSRLKRKFCRELHLAHDHYSKYDINSAAEQKLQLSLLAALMEDIILTTGTGNIREIKDVRYECRINPCE